MTLHNANEKRLPIKEYPGYNAVTSAHPTLQLYGGYAEDLHGRLVPDRNEQGYAGKPYTVFYSHGGGDATKESLFLFNQVGAQVE